MPDETAKQKEEKQRLEEKFQTHLSNCVLNCRMQELLGQYVAIEEYYMRESILKAIRLECRESGTLLSSVVDDCFFIISKSVRRALATSDVDCICAMLNHACALLETHHLAHLKSRLKLGYPSSTGGLAEAYSTAAIAYASVVHQGKMSGAGGIGSGSGSGGASGGGGIGDSTTDKLREDYLTALNDCGVSVECVEKLKNRLKDDFRNVLLQLNDVDQQKLDSCLGQLDETANKFHSALSDAVDQLVRTSFKPRLRLAVDGFFNDTHAPSELEFVELESRGLFVENIIGCLQLLLEDLRQSLGERPLAMVHATTASLTADLLEKATLKGTYNRLGGLLLDKQIRKLAGYWTQFAGWSTRQRFSRLDQIVSLLNVDSVADAQDYCQSESVTWLLNLAEIRQVLALRIDLPGNEILDERLYPFKGRCQLRQCMPKKPVKYGIKFWVACCSKSSYAWNMQIYTGKPSSGTREKNQGMRVVLDMPELPRELLQLQGRKLDSSTFAFSEDCTIVSYRPKMNNNVIVLNKMTSTYSSQRMTARWPSVICYNIIDVSAYNAYVLWTEKHPAWNVGRLHKRRLFVEELGKALVKPEMMRRNALLRTAATKSAVERLWKDAEQPSTSGITDTDTGGKKRARCQFCVSSDNKTGTDLLLGTLWLVD
ncbi:Conserved oligomeric Golgi complex subunit 4 [Trichinella murrelli]|uniref:Conserved oligomeric Golgi complex subunit 4 n=1 Tax=Trichinella murrelli TaxID=144512 RepID=A0A0V0T8P7_9BILA|nr:Conserved oligomeric Golgi complex subunit 4 [Trichinella murrelli]